MSSYEVTERVHAGTTLSVLAVEREDLIRVSLGQFGGEDMIPALRVVAETDPDPAENYAIRKWAAEAIVAIQQRAGQK
jgi:hypothetical protein